MLREELISMIALETGLSKVESLRVYSAVFKSITEALCLGERIGIDGFGIFNVKIRKGRITRNPSTGNPMTIAQSKVVKFTVAKNLKEKVSK